VSKRFHGDASDFWLKWTLGGWKTMNFHMEERIPEHASPSGLGLSLFVTSLSSSLLYFKGLE
jgi:hypothetical protein